MSLLQETPPEKMTPAYLWSKLDPETRTLAARAIYSPAQREASGRLEADHAIAGALRFRDVAVRKLPVDKRVHYLVRQVRPDDALASTLLSTLHLEVRSGLLATFLDALEIPHEGGLIDESYELEAFDGGRLAAAVAKLREGFPEPEVDVYLATLVAMDPDAWSGLVDAARGDSV